MLTARIGVAAGFALAATLLLSGTAAAHALPQSSDPSPGANLATPPTAVTITFGERPDPKLSSIKVLDTAGHIVSSGPAVPVAADPNQLTVPLSALGTGVYTVAWRTVSAVDGHLASGSFAFGVGTAAPTASQGAVAGPSAGAETPNGPSAGAIVTRWLLFLGLLGLLGAAAFGLLVAPPSSIVIRAWLPLAWLLAAVGTAGVLLVEIVESGATADQILGSSLGVALVGRAVPLAVAAVGVFLARRPSPRAGLWVVGIGSTAGLIVDVLLSHAAAGTAAASAVEVQAIHVLAVGLWLGGLAGLLLTMGRTADERTAELARRFSRVATVGIGTVAVTGILRAAQELGSIDALLTTDFGRVVTAKTSLFAVLAALGAVNHFRNVPAAGRRLGGLRRVGSAELLIGATVILLSASLVNLVPPAELAAANATPSPSPSPSPAPLVVDGHDFGTSVKLSLAVSPGTAGFNTFTVTVTDYDTGAPVAADGVTLRFVIPARTDVGSSRLDLPPAGPGVFSATGSNLSLDGTWQITATVARGATSVEVPLELTTRPTGDRLLRPVRPR